MHKSAIHISLACCETDLLAYLEKPFIYICFFYSSIQGSQPFIIRRETVSNILHFKIPW